MEFKCIQCCYHTVKLYVVCSKNMLNIYNCYDSSVIVSYTVHHWRTLRTKWLALYLFWDFIHLSMSICLFIVVTFISSYLMTVQVFLVVWYNVLLTADSWCILLYVPYLSVVLISKSTYRVTTCVFYWKGWHF